MSTGRKFCPSENILHNRRILLNPPLRIVIGPLTAGQKASLESMRDLWNGHRFSCVMQSVSLKPNFNFSTIKPR